MAGLYPAANQRVRHAQRVSSVSWLLSHTRRNVRKTADTGVLTMDATADAPLRIGNLRSAKSDKPIVAIGIEGSANKVGWERRSMCAYVLCPPAV